MPFTSFDEATCFLIYVGQHTEFAVIQVKEHVRSIVDGQSSVADIVQKGRQQQS